MSLRDRFKQAIEAQLHVASPRECNSATRPVMAQQAVQRACNDDAPPPGVDASRYATGDATGMQLPSCTGGATDVHQLHDDPGEVAGEPEAESPRAWPLLLAMGLDDERAEALTAWLRSRDAEGDDGRLCVECWHFGQRGKVCRHPHLVAIQAPRDLGQLATTPQHCPGFTCGDAARRELADFLGDEE